MTTDHTRSNNPRESLSESFKRIPYDLFSIPFTLVQVEIAKLRHILRQQEQVRLAVDDVLSVGLPPIDVADAERLEQLFLRKIERVLPGELRNQRRENVWVSIVVKMNCPGSVFIG